VAHDFASLDPLRRYLDQPLLFFEDRIEVQASGVQVMMRWETPLMQRMAQLVAARRGDVLEIGFGMGISASAIQALRPKSHTIIEAHPQIITRAEAWAANRPGVRVLAGLWQERLPDAGTFDGILFDIFGGSAQRQDFVDQLHRVLRPGGAATLWLGDERDLAAPLCDSLARQNLGYRLSRVSAIPDKSCRYSQTNEFYVPLITWLGADDAHGGSELWRVD
jgi:SAM-dependent methyltransferase